MVALFVNVPGLCCEVVCGMYGTDGAHPSEGESWARFVTEGPALSVSERGIGKMGLLKIGMEMILNP